MIRDSDDLRDAVFVLDYSTKYYSGR